MVLRMPSGAVMAIDGRPVGDGDGDVRDRPGRQPRARSPSGSSARCGRWASAASPCTATPTPARCTPGWPTSPSRSARPRPRRATCRSSGCSRRPPHRRAGHPPRLRVPVGERRVRPRLREGRDRVHRTAGRRDRGDGRQDPRQADRDGRRRAGRPGPHRAGHDRRPGRRRRGRGRLPGAAQAQRGRRRQGHARGPRPRTSCPTRSPRPPRGARLLRRRHAAGRALRRQLPAHRGAGVRRLPRQRHPPRRARVQPAAAAPEGHRGGAVAAARHRVPGVDGPRGGRGGEGGRLHRRRHGRVHRRRRPARGTSSSWR